MLGDGLPLEQEGRIRLAVSAAKPPAIGMSRPKTEFIPARISSQATCMPGVLEQNRVDAAELALELSCGLGGKVTAVRRGHTVAETYRDLGPGDAYHSQRAHRFADAVTVDNPAPVQPTTVASGQAVPAAASI